MFHPRETGDEPGIVVAEATGKPQWYQLRKVFSVGRKQNSLFTFALPKTLKVNQREDHAVVFLDCN